jgi:type IV pilus assembly protein PilX
MLNRLISRRVPAAMHKRQSGIVLIMVLIVLVAMTLAAIAMVRSVDTTNLIAGNLAFQQAATHSGDSGVETASTWLASNMVGVALENDDPTNGYVAGGLKVAPDLTKNPPQTWDDFWSKTLAARAVKSSQADSAGNVVSYVIDRLCTNPGSVTSGASCVDSPAISIPTGNSQEGGEKQLNSSTGVYYRITVRVDGPRNTVSYVQSVVSM